MPIPVTCECGRSFKAKDEHAGLRAKCPTCQAIVQIPSADSGGQDLRSGLLPSDDDPGVSVSGESAIPATDETRLLLKQVVELLKDQNSAVPSKTQSRREYKVLSQKDKWFSGKFDPDRLEQAVNAMANQGWEVKGVATATIPGFGGAREEIIVLLEREHV